MAHCNQCGFEWQPRVENPTVCTRCKRYDWREPKKGGRHGSSKDDDVRGTGSDAEGGKGRSRDGTSLPVLRKAKGKPEQLHPVQPVRSELVASGGGGHNERPSPEPHKDHRTYKAGEQRYCQDCGKFY